MSMRILKVGSANARFAQHEQKVAAECEELSDLVCEAIEAVDVDTKNRWGLNGYSTCRVAYVDVSAYLPETIAAVAMAFQNEGYLVNPMVMEAGGDDPDVTPTMTMLAILWDPEASLGICQSVGEEETALPDAVETLNNAETVAAAEGASPAEPVGPEEPEEGAAQSGAAPDPVSEAEGEPEPEGFPV